MSVSKETELIIKLKHLPGFGPKNVELVAKAMIERNLFSDNDITSYIRECIKTHYIRLNKEFTLELCQKAIDEAQRVLDKSLNNYITHIKFLNLDAVNYYFITKCHKNYIKNKKLA